MAELQYKNSDKTFLVRTDEENLAYYEDLIAEIAETGEKYAADGSLEVEHNMEFLEKMRDKYEKRVLAARGLSGRNKVV